MVISLCKKGEYIYKLFESQGIAEGGEICNFYGISIIGNDEQAVVENISENYDSVRYLFSLIVEEELYPVHLYDVVDDYLSAPYPKVIPLSMFFPGPGIA